MKICFEKRGRELIKTFIFYFYLHCLCCLDYSLPLSFFLSNLPPISSFVFILLAELVISTFLSGLSFIVTYKFADLFVLIILIAGFDLICLLLKNFKGFYAIELIRKGFQIINLFASKINHLLFKYVQLLFRRDIKQMLILFVGLDLYQHFANCYTIEEVFHHLIK
jgi:hypothetical protein